MRRRARVEATAASGSDLAGTPSCAKHSHVVAAQRDDQVGAQMVDCRPARRGGRWGSRGRAARRLARSSADLPTCQPPVPALVTRTALSRPRSLDLVGEHLLGHRRPADVAGADERHVQRNQTPSTSRSSATVETCTSGRATAGPAKSPPPYPQLDHDGVDAVVRRAVHVMARGHRPSRCARAAAAVGPKRARRTSALVARTPSGLAPAIDLEMLGRGRNAPRIFCAVGSALEVATASRTPAARRSASSAGDPVEHLLITHPRVV